MTTPDKSNNTIIIIGVVCALLLIGPYFSIHIISSPPELISDDQSTYPVHNKVKKVTKRPKMPKPNKLNKDKDFEKEQDSGKPRKQPANKLAEIEELLK